MNDNNEQIESKKEKKIKIIELFTNKRYRAIGSLLFYFILIFVLIVMVRTSPSNINYNSNSDKTNDLVKINGFENISKKNFDFKYSLIINDKSIIYEGKQYNNKVLLTDKVSNKQYFYQDKIMLVSEKDNFVLTDNITNYFDYLDIELIQKIVNELKFDDGDYIISVFDFLDIIDEKDSKELYSEEDNIYVEFIRKNDIVTEVDFDLTDFDLENDKVNSVTLKLEFSNFGLIEDFKINKK